MVGLPLTELMSILGVPVALGVFIFCLLYGQGRVPGTFPFYKRHVRNADPRKRLMVARALAGAPVGGVALLRLLAADPEPEVRHEAAVALAAYPVDLTSAILIPLLTDVSATVRRVAVKCLEDCEDPVVVDALDRALLDQDHGVKIAVIKALGKLQEPRTTASLVQLLATGSEDLKHAAHEALRRIGDLAFETILQMLPAAGANAEDLVEVLLQLDRQAAFEPLVQVLRTTPSAPVVRHVSAALIRVGNPQTLQVLLEQVANTSAVGRDHLVEALRFFSDPATVPPLLAALEDRDRKVRRAAARVLSGLREPVPVDPLIAALGDDEREVARWVAVALGRQNEPRVVMLSLERLFGHEAVELAHRFEEASGTTVESLSSYFGLVKALEKLLSQPYTAELLRFKEILQSLVIVLYGDRVRGLRDTGSSVTLIIKGLHLSSTIKEDRLHPLARTLLTYVKDTHEAGRWQEAG